MNVFRKGLALIFALSLNVLSFTSLASEEESNNFSQAELEQMLAPIALYPDSLLTHILIASTYPLEIIQAQRWLNKHPNSDADEIEDGVENKDWDASVKALMPFPRVIKRLNDDLDWTQKIGDAFLQNEQQVLASIQILRQKADTAGSLKQMDNMDIRRDKKSIIIKSVEPEIVYVPYYDSRYVYGDWDWYNYPPVYWNISHHHNLYSRNYDSPFYWYSGVTISFNYFFNAFHWHDHRVVVVNDYAPNHRRSYSYGYQINHHKTKAWRHNPAHRRGVAYRSNLVKQRYHSNRVSLSERRNNQKRTRASHALQRKVAPSGGYQKVFKANHYVNQQERLTKQMKKNRHNAEKNQSRNVHKDRVKTATVHVVNNQKKGDQPKGYRQKSYTEPRKQPQNRANSRSVYRENTVAKQSNHHSVYKSRSKQNSYSQSSVRSTRHEKSTSRSHQTRSKR